MFLGVEVSCGIAGDVPFTVVPQTLAVDQFPQPPPGVPSSNTKRLLMVAGTFLLPAPAANMVRVRPLKVTAALGMPPEPQLGTVP